MMLSIKLGIHIEILNVTDNRILKSKYMRLVISQTDAPWMQKDPMRSKDKWDRSAIFHQGDLSD